MAFAGGPRGVCAASGDVQRWAFCGRHGRSDESPCSGSLSPRPYLSLRKDALAQDGLGFLEATRLATEAERKDTGGDKAARGFGVWPSRALW